MRWPLKVLVVRGDDGEWLVRGLDDLPLWEPKGRRIYVLATETDQRFYLREWGDAYRAGVAAAVERLRWHANHRPALTAHRLEEGAIDIEEHMLLGSMRKRGLK